LAYAEARSGLRPRPQRRDQVRLKWTSTHPVPAPTMHKQIRRPSACGENRTSMSLSCKLKLRGSGAPPPHAIRFGPKIESIRLLQRLDTPGDLQQPQLAAWGPTCSDATQPCSLQRLQRLAALAEGLKTTLCWFSLVWLVPAGPKTQVAVFKLWFGRRAIDVCRRYK
jgi:hypothetical protein